MGQPIFFVLKDSVDKASTRMKEKHYKVKWRNPFFWNKVSTVRIPKRRNGKFHFLVYKHRVGEASARKGVKHLKEEWIEYPSLVH